MAPFSCTIKWRHCLLRIAVSSPAAGFAALRHLRMLACGHDLSAITELIKTMADSG